MSIKSEIERIRANVAAAYEAAEELGAELPAQRSSDNLAQLIRGLQGTSGPSDGACEATIKSSVSTQLGSLTLHYVDADAALRSVPVIFGSGLTIRTPSRLVILECTTKGLGSTYTGISLAESDVQSIMVGNNKFVLAAALSGPSPEITVRLYKS